MVAIQVEIRIRNLRNTKEACNHSTACWVPQYGGYYLSFRSNVTHAFRLKRLIKRHKSVLKHQTASRCIVPSTKTSETSGAHTLSGSYRFIAFSSYENSEIPIASVYRDVRLHGNPARTRCMWQRRLWRYGGLGSHFRTLVGNFAKGGTTKKHIVRKEKCMARDALVYL